MGSYSYEYTIDSSIAPTRLFKACFIYGKDLLPKVVPHEIKGGDILKGDGGAGTVYLIHFGEGNPSKTVKQIVDVLDEENRIYKITVVEGDGFGDFLDSISQDVQIDGSDGGGSVVKVHTTYHTNVEVPEDKLKELEVEVKKGDEKGLAIHRAIEAYLLAHPDECID